MQSPAQACYVPNKQNAASPIRSANNNVIVNVISMNLTIEGDLCPSMNKQNAPFDRHNAKGPHNSGFNGIPLFDWLHNVSDRIGSVLEVIPCPVFFKTKIKE